jgi:hypothetical protein
MGNSVISKEYGNSLLLVRVEWGIKSDAISLSKLVLQTGLIRLAISSAIVVKKWLKLFAIVRGSVISEPLSVMELIFCLFLGFFNTSFKMDHVFSDFLSYFPVHMHKMTFCRL